MEDDKEDEGDNVQQGLGLSNLAETQSKTFCMNFFVCLCYLYNKWAAE